MNSDTSSLDNEVISDSNFDSDSDQTATESPNHKEKRERPRLPNIRREREHAWNFIQGWDEKLFYWQFRMHRQGFFNVFISTKVFQIKSFGMILLV